MPLHPRSQLGTKRPFLLGPIERRHFEIPPSQSWKAGFRETHDLRAPGRGFGDGPFAATRGEARAMIIVIAPWSPEAERCRPQSLDVAVSVVPSGRVLWRCSVRLRPVTDFE